MASGFKYECKECAVVVDKEGVTFVDERIIFGGYTGIEDGGKAIKAVHRHLEDKRNVKALLVHFHEYAFKANTNEWVSTHLYTIGTQVMMVFYRGQGQR